MFQHDSFFFIGVFVFIFLLWLVLGGAPRPPSLFCPPLPPPPGRRGAARTPPPPTVRFR